MNTDTIITIVLTLFSLACIVLVAVASCVMAGRADERVEAMQRRERFVEPFRGERI